MARPISIVSLTPEEENELKQRSRASTCSRRDCLRAEIVLLRAKGVREIDVAKQLAVSLPCVSKWSKRFEHQGLDGLTDKAGRGRKPSLPLEKVEQVISQATRPPKGCSRWSVRTMAKAAGVSHDSVRRIWLNHEIKPHLTRTFKVSTDPLFEQKFWDVIALYLNPPAKALVLCCDEKSQCQALERTQPGLPLGMGHIRTRTHDYERHGTITLFAAMSYLEGKILSRTEDRHTHIEWLRFMKQINRETPKELTIHLIVDNYCTHKNEVVKQWLIKHPRFVMHFTPTGSSWMNLVERFFRDLTEDVVREGSFISVRELVKAIEQYLAARNADPKPYRWKAKGEEILAKIQRAKDALNRGTKKSVI
jgi:transposase